MCSPMGAFSPLCTCGTVEADDRHVVAQLEGELALSMGKGVEVRPGEAQLMSCACTAAGHLS